jgi:hypothetical protein
LICPVCGDRNRCTLDDIGQHIHTFSVSPLSWPAITSPSDKLESSQEDESSYSDTEDLIDGETPATSITGGSYQVSRSAGSVRSQAQGVNVSTVTFDDVRQSFNTTTNPVSASPKYRNQAFDTIQSPRYTPSHRPPTSTKDLGSVWEAAKNLLNYGVPPKPTDPDPGPYTSLQPKFVHDQAPIVTSVPDRTLETSSIIEWMSPVDPTENYEQAVKLRYPGTGRWFLESESFSRYKTGAIRNICLNGEPGCGKTVLSSTIITYLAMDPDRVTVYFFFDSRDTKKQTGDAMLLSLVSQLFCRRKECRSPLMELYDEAGKASVPTGQTLRQVLDEMIKLSIVQVHIVLDALDECREQDIVLVHVRQMLSWNYTKTRVIVTGRNAFHIGSSIPVEGELFPIQQQDTDKDIKMNVLGRLNSAEFSHRFPNHEVPNKMRTGLLRKCEGKS